jgi:putative transposase
MRSSGCDRMGLDGKLIDELLAGRSTVAETARENGLLKQLTKAILERALAAELTAHVGYEKALRLVTTAATVRAESG